MQKEKEQKEAEEKLKKEQEEKERFNSLNDKDKLKKYFEDISAIEVPELKSKNSNEIISTIKSFMAYINNQINFL